MVDVVSHSVQWNNVKRDFKVFQNVGELSKTEEKINVSEPEKQGDMSSVLPFTKEDSTRCNDLSKFYYYIFI
jgi:hypothetical protein